MSRAGMRCDSEELAPGRARPAPSTGLSTTSEASAQPTTTGRDPAAAAKRMNMLRMASTAKTTATTVTVVSVCDVATGASSSGLSEGTARRRAEDGWLAVASRATTDMVPCFLRRRRCGARPCPARLCVRPSSLGPAVNVQHLRALRYVVSITSARRCGGRPARGRLETLGRGLVDRGDGAARAGPSRTRVAGGGSHGPPGHMDRNIASTSMTPPSDSKSARTCSRRSASSR